MGNADPLRSTGTEAVACACMDSEVAEKSIKRTAGSGST
jgi:hypothetical protein